MRTETRNTNHGPRIIGQPGCPHCAGTGYVPVGRDFFRVCTCAKPDLHGLLPRSAVILSAAKNLTFSPERIEELKATLENLIRQGRCPHGADPKPERAFLSALSDAWGEDHAVPREQIEELTGMTERETKKMAEHLVADHHLSDLGLVLGRYRQFRKRTSTGEVVIRGYFWCLTPEEALRSCQAYWRQIITSLRTLDAWVGRLGLRPKLRAAIRELEGQYRLQYGVKP